LEVGGWRLEVGGWRLEVGGWPGSCRVSPMRRALSNPLPLIRWAFRALMITVSSARAVLAQDLTPSIEPPARDAAPERPGLLDEPSVIRRAALIFDRRINFAEATEGPYTLYGKMIPGAGISGGLGYRRWYAHDRAFVDASAQGSWRGYTTAQARFELPRLARSRLLVRRSSTSGTCRLISAISICGSIRMAPVFACTPGARRLLAWMSPLAQKDGD
jgi:hypothetical protein